MQMKKRSNVPTGNLAKKYHPTPPKYNKRAEQKFKEVTEAYNVLSDP